LLARDSRVVIASVVTRRILIVDGDESFRMSLSDGLRRRGHAIHHTGDAIAAVSIANRTKPEVVLVEISHPEPHGFERARILRRLLPGALLIGITAQARLAPQEQDQSGIACMFLKPVVLDDLVPLIEGWIPPRRSPPR
jgi:CheY-like chemotaxis protein